MKKIITSAVIISFGLSSVGCSTNTKNQNTAIGTVAGAVIGGLVASPIGNGTGKAIAIGAGAIIGALFGGYVGNKMQNSDTVQSCSALDKNQVNETSCWYNSKTGTTYTVTPTSPRRCINGNQNCRNYTATTVTKCGKRYVARGVACRQPDGSWLAAGS